MRKRGAGATWASRAILGFGAMVGAWICSCGYLLLLKASVEPGLQVRVLAVWSGMFSAVTYSLLVVPIVAPLPRSFQLRSFPAVVALALVWDCLIFRGFFREWPWAVMSTQGGPFLLIWFAVFTSFALAIYFALLWRGAHIESRAAAEVQTGT